MTRGKNRGDAPGGKAFDGQGIGQRLRARLGAEPLTQLGSCTTCTGVVRKGCRPCALANAALSVDDLLARRVKEVRAEDVERVIADAERLLGRGGFVREFAQKAREAVVLMKPRANGKPERRELWSLARVLAEGGFLNREIAALLEGEEASRDRGAAKKRVQRWLRRGRDRRLDWDLLGAYVPGNERTPFKVRTLTALPGGKKGGGHLRGGGK